MRLAFAIWSSELPFGKEEIKRPRSASEVDTTRRTTVLHGYTRFFGSFSSKKNLAGTKNEQRETWYTNGIPYLVVTSMSNDSDRCHKKVNDCPSYAISLEGTETSRATYLTTKESSQKKMASHLETGHSGHKKTA